MFSDFAIEQLVVDRRLLVNRQNLKKMYRVWFQGRFRKLRDGEVDSGVREERGVRDMDDEAMRIDLGHGGVGSSKD